MKEAAGGSSRPLSAGPLRLRPLARSLLVATILSSAAAAVELETGDILVANGDGAGTINHVDPVTGDRTTTSQDFPGGDPWGIAFDPVRRVAYLGNEFAGELVEEDLATGVQSVMSRHGTPPAGSGPDLSSIRATVAEPDGTLVVADTGIDALVAVHPASGARTIISSDGVGSGPALASPIELARAADGSLLVLETASDSVLRVDRVTGDRTVVSSNSTGTGPAFVSPQGLAVEPGGTLLVGDTSSDHVLAIDPTTGDRTVVSSETVGNGPALLLIEALAIDPGGDLLVADRSGTKLVHVDRLTGDRTVVASPSVGSGPTVDCNDIEMEATGDVLARVSSGLLRIDVDTGDRVLLAPAFDVDTGGPALGLSSLALEPAGATVATAGGFLVVRVALATGDRTLVSATPTPDALPVGSGPALSTPLHLLVEPAGTVLVSDPDLFAFPGPDPRILRVSPETGDRALVSSATRGDGPDFGSVMDLARTPDGRVFVVDPAEDAVLEVDPLTGDRSIVTGQGVGSGPALSGPIGLAVEPSGTLVVADLDLAAVVRVDVASGARSLVSGAGAGSGTAFSAPTELAVEGSGGILVTDYSLAAVFRVNPLTGQRTVLSMNGGPGGGTGFLDIARGIALVEAAPSVPALPRWGLGAAAAALLLGVAVFGRTRSRRAGYR